MTELFIDFRETKTLDEALFNVRVGEKWANKELQHYVNKKENLFFTDEGLVLRATNPQAGLYESVRINTKNKVSFTYGEVTFVAKVPEGKGTWPALWMLSETNPYGHWPRSGEIDIMEHVGRDKDTLFLCLHTERYNHTKQSEQYYKEHHLDNATTAFHSYGIKWVEDAITYFVDGQQVASYSKFDKTDQSHKGWPFDHPYFLIMNLAIGGKFGGEVDDSIFPQDFIIQSIHIKY